MHQNMSISGKGINLFKENMLSLQDRGSIFVPMCFQSSATDLFFVGKDQVNNKSKHSNNTLIR